MEVVETHDENILLDGWSLDLYGSRNRGGLGVSKDIWKKGVVEVDAGVFVTKELKHLLDLKVKPELSLGVSVKGRF
jgi:hypothetical protein